MCVCVFSMYGFATAPQAILIIGGETEAHLSCCLQSNGGGARQRQRWDEAIGRELLPSISSQPWVCSSSSSASLRWTPTNKSNCALSSLISIERERSISGHISVHLFFFYIYISVQRRAWGSSRRLNQWSSAGGVSGPTFSFLIMKARAKFIPQHSHK